MITKTIFTKFKKFDPASVYIMKMIRIYILLLLVMVSACRPKQNYTEKKLPVYEVDTSMHSILSRIIKEERKCVYYDKNSCFSFNCEIKDGLLEIRIIAEYMNNYDFSYCYGIFKFNDHYFICEGDSLTKLLKQQNDDSLIVKYRNKDEELVIPNIDDRYSYWVFYHRNNKFESIVEAVCRRKRIK